MDKHQFNKDARNKIEEDYVYLSMHIYIYLNRLQKQKKSLTWNPNVMQCRCL